MQKVNYRHRMDDDKTVLIRDETRMTGIQIYLLLHADEHVFDLYDYLLVIAAGVGLVLLLRMIMLVLVRFCTSDSVRYNDVKYADVVGADLG